MTKRQIVIVSGGQTGVDRGGLEAASDLGLEWGGWAPKGWRAEDDGVPLRFRGKMREHASSNYLARTRQNVADSQATLIVIGDYPLFGGTLKTRTFCEEMLRSHFVIALSDSAAVAKTQKWLGQFFAADRSSSFVLNVAGPRESKMPGIQERTRQFLIEVLNGVLDSAGDAN